MDSVDEDGQSFGLRKAHRLNFVLVVRINKVVNVRVPVVKADVRAYWIVGKEIVDIPNKEGIRSIDGIFVKDDENVFENCFVDAVRLDGRIRENI